MMLQFVIRSVFARVLLLVALACPPMTAWAAGGDVTFQSNVYLTETEQNFLAELVSDKERMDDLVQSAWLLIAVGTTMDVPKPGRTARETIANFAESVAKLEASKDVPASTLSKAAKGLKQLGARRIWEQLALFVSGSHGDYKDYRPKGVNYEFFRMLEERFRLIAQGDF